MLKTLNVKILAVFALTLLLNSCSGIESYLHPKEVNLPFMGTYHRDKTRVIVKKKYIKQVKYIKGMKFECPKFKRVDNVRVSDIKKYSERYTLVNTMELYTFVQMCKELRVQSEKINKNKGH